jgi:hypothetical protein
VKIYRNSIVKKIVVLYFIVTYCLTVAADDTIKVKDKPLPLKYYTLNQFEYNDSIRSMYNTLQSLHNYTPRNTFGNTGLAYNDFIYSYPFPFGFNYGRNYFRNYFYTPYSILFYNTRIPYTDLLYVFGSQREQFFKMTFSYNIKKNWNFSANFSAIKGTGFYIRQKSDDLFFCISSNYKARNNRYMLLASGAFNSIKTEENGGMINDSLFFAGRTNYDPSLRDAKVFRLNKNVFVKQYFNLGHQLHDTMPVQVSSRFMLTSQFEDNASKFTDSNPKSAYYKHIYYDSTKTNDSTYFLRLENELAWKRVDNLKHRGILDMIGLGFSLKHQYVYVEQRELKIRQMDTTFHNILAGAELSNLYSNHQWFWKFTATYGLKGYNKDDREWLGSITKTFGDSLSRWSLNARIKKYAPPFIYNAYASNHFKWENQFEKSIENTIAANLHIHKYDVSLQVDFTNYSNVLYFDTIVIPRQYEGTIPVLSAVLIKNISFHNWHLDNHIRYQRVPDSSVIRVPEFILKHALYYENDLFKKALRLQIGVQLMYNTAYYANAYMPVTGQFYLQNQRKYGNYPIFDFFLNFKVKAVNAFFKIDHLNSGFSGNNYMLTPHYIINQRAFRLGVSWKFWD